MLADEVDYVLGVDTHRDEHAMAVVAAPAGGVVAGATAAANGRGYRELFRVAQRHAPGRRAWAIEGSGSYGAVLEISRLPRTERRLTGKDDALDAVRIARAALASETLALPRAGERRDALRLLLIARRSAVDVRREVLTQLRAVIVTAPEPLREQLRRLSPGSCSTAAAASAAQQHPHRTSSPSGSCSAASPAASRLQPSRPPTSSARSSPTSAHSPRPCSTSPESDRSSLPS